jgi:hypothetical protein
MGSAERMSGHRVRRALGLVGISNNLDGADENTRIVVFVIKALSRPQVMPLVLCSAGLHAAAHAITASEADLTSALMNPRRAEDTAV